MPHRLSLAARDLGAALGLAACLGGCASAPHLNAIQLENVGRAQIYYVQPQDALRVVTTKGDVAKGVASTVLFGFIGLGTYIGVKSTDKTEIGFKAQQRYELMQKQGWPSRIQAAVRAALSQSSEFSSAPITELPSLPLYSEMSAMAGRSDADTVLFIAPELRIISSADRLTLALQVYAFRHQHRGRCSSCSYLDMHGSDQVIELSNQTLNVDQDLQTLSGGKTWAEQEEAGHRRHALSLEDYVGFWFSGEPLHLARFLDAAIPAAQLDLLFYLTDEGEAAAPLPPQQWVID